MTIDETWLDGAVEAAREAARAAANVIAHYASHGVGVDYKADATPVTAADQEAETAIRKVLSAHFPEHAFYGEEHGREGDSDFMWLIDPLDGTKSFVRDTPFYSTQIALMHQGELLVGVSAAPHYGEILWARRGGGAWRDGKRIQVAPTQELANASLSLGNMTTLAGDRDRWLAVGQLLREVDRHRGYGDFCQYHLLASGSLDAVLESDVNILDIAALAVIVREAGGVFTDLEGAELDLDTTSVRAAVPALHGPLGERINAAA